MSQLSISSQNPTVNDNSFSPITRRHFQAMLLVMIVTLLYVAFETQMNTPTVEQSSPIVQKVILVIDDDKNGDILLTVSKTRQQSAINSPPQIMRFTGEQGFLRGTLRALARDRRMRNLTSESPFELTLFKDGRLSIIDTLTGRGIDLEAFGPDNVAVFSKILAESAQN